MIIISAHHFVRIQESAEFGVVIAGLKVIQPGFRVVVIAAVTVGVEFDDLCGVVGRIFSA